VKRRELIGNFARAAGAALYDSATRLLPAEAPGEPSLQVKRVLVTFKCHFDLGFVDTQAGVMRKYFEQYYPEAIRIAAGMRDSGQDRYVWTTGSWLLYEYLEQATSESRLRMEQAIAAGDIAWHALPFTWQTEMLDRSMIVGALGLSKSLDRRFGRATTGAKMTDVPGHSRGLVGPLSEGGVTFLDIGVNSASTPPDVPRLFLWKDADGASLIVMYHHKEYGGVVEIPGSDVAVAVQVRDDNSGPHPVSEIRKIYDDLRKKFPNANITAANFTDVAHAVQPFRGKLPVVTDEIGDTWIYGVPSDPVKVARYREMARLRREWIAQQQLIPGDPTDVALLRRLALAVEHTWGTDTKTWLDFDHYTPHDLAAVLQKPNYRTVEKSWAEKRGDINQGVASLPIPLRQQAESRLAALQPIRPALAGLNPHQAGAVLESAHFAIAIDPATGAIQQLRNKSNGRQWASAGRPLALFSYQTLSKEDYGRFLASYITVQTDWAPKDFGKPNIDHFGAESQTWVPKLAGLWSGRAANAHRLLAELMIDDAAAERAGRVAWPQRMYLELVLPDDAPLAHVHFSWFGKARNRLPEALWLSFQPDAPQTPNWRLEKVEREISPFEVVRGGNRHMHALSGKISYKDSGGSFSIETLDAPAVMLGEKSPIYFSNAEPDMGKGVHFSLFNNGWGTNYIQWFGEDMRFRFTLRA
jgi:hypothetical protein